MDFSVTFPREGRIRLESRSLFSDPQSVSCRRFVDLVSAIDEVENVTVRGGRGLLGSNSAEIRYKSDRCSLEDAIAAISAQLTRDDVSPKGLDESASKAQTGPTHPNGRAPVNGRENGHDVEVGFVQRIKAHALRLGEVAKLASTARREAVASNVSEWSVLHEIPGRIRLGHERLHRRKEACQAIERELMSVLGIDVYKTNPLTGSVLIQYDRRQLSRDQVIEILDSALAQSESAEGKDKADLQLALSTVSLPLSAIAQFVAPPLIPVAAGLFLYTSIPTFRGAREVIFEERRLGVDVLDAIVVVGCLGTLQVFPGAVLCWCLDFGRMLVKKTQDDSKKLLMNAFGKQPRFVWLVKDGVEAQVSLDKLRVGDLIVVNTGEAVPVDGFVKDGMAVIDQHALTGESTPAEKGVGDRVFASTIMVAGKIFIEVEKAGNETASAQISQILNDTAGYKLTSQHKGERMADKAVIPTLALASVGMATLGPAGAVAILNSDFGTGIRMAAPLAMLSSLTLCANKGILIKDGRALELMNDVDTVLFDKTGTLTRERPEVGRVLACDGHEADEILRFAAAAERKFSHPIAKAILHEAEAKGLDLPPIDDSKYKLGYGISVHVEGRTVRVGSPRFMDLESVPISPTVRQALDEAHLEGNTYVMVAVDDHLGGAIELRAAERPEVRAIIRGLRERGIGHIAIISGDQEGPTRKLAESLGMDQYFAQVLPADKARYVEQLQAEGRKVCFVGDGINDSIALKKANVSISLRGATSIATDTAHIVFMEEGLGKLCDLRDIAHDLDQNVRRSWQLILAPNCLAIVGAFTMGFGIMTSVVTNNVAALLALGNGLLPLRKVAEAQAESLREQEKRLASVNPLRREAQASVAELPRMADPVEAVPPAVEDDMPMADRDSGLSRSELGECLYERPLRRPFENAMRDGILVEAERRRPEIPMPTEFEWQAADPVLTIRSPMITFNVSFSPDNLAVHAKVSKIARPLLTDGNRRKAIQFVEEVAGHIDL